MYDGAQPGSNLNGYQNMIYRPRSVYLLPVTYVSRALDLSISDKDVRSGDSESACLT